MTTEKVRCSEDGCGKKSFAKGLCSTHYSRDLQNRKQNQRQELKKETASYEAMAEPTVVQKGAAPMPIPYPGFEEIDEGGDIRAFYKYLTNVTTMMLNEEPDHPNRDAIIKSMQEQKRIAEMDDERFRLHELHEANPLHKLSHDEKLHCIRTLPLSIVQKLFPRL